MEIFIKLVKIIFHSVCYKNKAKRKVLKLVSHMCNGEFHDLLLVVKDGSAVLKDVFNQYYVLKSIDIGNKRI